MYHYKYETHLHTREASACADSAAVDYIPAYLDAGFSGIIVTDHFFDGNTSISPRYRWDERVRRFMRGYKIAKAAGDRAGLSVFLGWEACFGEDEYLIYGLTEEWLLDNPDVLDWDHATLFQEVDRHGGLMVQAHPFRERYWNTGIFLHPYASHGVEVVNGANDLAHDQRARLYAEEYNLLMTSGTDIHHTSRVTRNTRGMAFAEPLASIEEFISAVKSRENYSLLESPAHRAKPAIREPNLPVYHYDDRPFFKEKQRRATSY